MSLKRFSIPRIALKIAIVAALAMIIYYAYEGIPAALSAPPIFAAIFITLIVAAIIAGALSLLT